MAHDGGAPSALALVLVLVVAGWRRRRTVI
jgi:uncharacterized protein (TIGR03382 family)